MSWCSQTSPLFQSNKGPPSTFPFERTALWRLHVLFEPYEDLASGLTRAIPFCPSLLPLLLSSS